MVTINSCSLFGSANYVNEWVLIALLAILSGFLIVAIVYMLGSQLPGSTRSKINSVLRSEVTQLVLGVFIIVILVFATSVACTVTNAIGQTIILKNGQPISSVGGPIAYSLLYIQNLVTNQGFGLLSLMYSQAFAEATTSLILTQFSQALGSFFLGGGFGPSIGTSSLTVTFKIIPAYDLGLAHARMADLYLDVFAPLAMIAIGLLFLQYLATVIVQQAAFLVILPVALIMRLLVFSGSGAKTAANAVLALAIAAYIVYPLAVVFDGYALSWISNPSLNPSQPYLASTDSGAQFGSISSVLSGAGSAGCTSQAGCTLDPTSLLGSGFLSSLGLLAPGASESAAQGIVTQLASLLFMSIIMTAVNLMITFGFAMGLTRALDAGVEGAASFWSSL